MRRLATIALMLVTLSAGLAAAPIAGAEGTGCAPGNAVVTAPGATAGTTVSGDSDWYETPGTTAWDVRSAGNVGIVVYDWDGATSCQFRCFAYAVFATCIMEVPPEGGHWLVEVFTFSKTPAPYLLLVG